MTNHENDPWVVEDLAGELVEDDPRTSQWWTPEAARAHVQLERLRGQEIWAYPRTAIGLVI